MGCCYSSADDDESESLMGRKGNSERSEEARRKAAEAALLRAGAMAQRLRRPQPAAKPASTGGKSFTGSGMRWDGG